MQAAACTETQRRMYNEVRLLRSLTSHVIFVPLLGVSRESHVEDRGAVSVPLLGLLGQNYIGNRDANYICVVIS